MPDSFKLPPLYTVLDLALLLLVGAVSAGFYGDRLFSRRGAGPLEAVVQFENKELARLDLGRDTTLTVRGTLGTVTVVVADGAVRFKDSSCPAHICEKTGWVKRAGGAIVCAPNHLLARVERADGDASRGGLDAVTR
jgi:hypothetical protein